ncbi:hypothetical protein EG328_004000 [Venturia inaequalis]|uniref:Ubiquitin-like protease family profile domain-containing protein n=1 Tax=Venturia inaequalis TaxID=5025 RepID=A0A8H3YUC0_VENIN|nr:hypothetical protein EG328_004000 [Venturia inaequalis]
MSPKSFNNKAARPGRTESETSAKAGHLIDETTRANVSSISQAPDYTGESSSIARASRKRSAAPDYTDPERSRKMSKNGQPTSAAPYVPSKIESGKETSRRTDLPTKNPSPQSSTFKHFESLKKEVRALRKIPLDEPDQPKRKNSRVGKVAEKVYLTDDQVTLAIAAVTEVVNHFYNPEMYLWSLLSSTTLGAAQKYPPLDRSLCPRLIRSKLVFPMFFTPKNLMLYPDAVTDYKDKAIIYASDQDHIFLVKVLFNRGKSRLPQLVILDSSPSFVDRSSEEWQLAVDEMRRIATNLGIYDPPAPDVNVTPLPSLESIQIAFEPEIEIQVARQQNGWACGVHTIMNAWADALLFRTNLKCTMSADSYKRALDVINLVLEGRATLHLVSLLLVSTGFVLHGNKQQGQAITEMRQDSKLFQKYHQINSTADLNSRIDFQSYDATERVKDLVQKNQPDSALALSVAEWTVLPRLRKTALRDKVDAAKDAAIARLKKEETEGQEEEDPKLPIDKRTVQYFKNKVQRSSAAKLSMDKFCKALKQQGLISDADESDKIGKDHKAEKDRYQEARNEFIRLLGYRLKFTETDYWWKWADSELLELYFEVWFDRKKAEDLADPISPNRPPT